MGLQLVTAPVSDPVTLIEAKAQCRVDSDDEDGLIAGFLLAARQGVEDFTRRCLSTSTWDLTIDCGWPCQRVQGYSRQRIMLPKPPLQSVESVQYVDTAGVTQTLAADQYLVDASGMEGRIEPAYNVTWPSVRNQMAAVRVRFVAGYTALPEPIRQAILLSVAHFYDIRATVVVGSIATEIPMSAQALLFPYRVFY